MPSAKSANVSAGDAEQEFRAAFTRLKNNSPLILPKGTLVTQNNVAKEADRDPSALRKSRYPALIREIQQWIMDNYPKKAMSSSEKDGARRRRNRTLKEKFDAYKVQHNLALSKLVEADMKILELTIEIAELRSKLPPNRIQDIFGTKPKKTK